MDEPTWTIGVEEEYLLVDSESGKLIQGQPSGLMEKVADIHHGIVARELFESQIEIATDVCANIKDLRAELQLLRLGVHNAADEYGMTPIAASAHPFACWQNQRYTQGERYQTIAHDLQGVACRLLISGLHVHVGIEDPDLRIDLMGQVTYFLPHLMALSTSSPFWEGENTGLKSFRMTLFKALPRTGLPERFNSWSDFRRHVEVLTRANIIEDATKVWWHIRPSERYPTLEMRVTDLPTKMEDTITVAAMYVCLLRMLWRLRLENRRWRSYSNFLLSENLWRSQRYGVRESLIDFGLGRLVPFPDLLEEMLEMVAPDAEALDCVDEVNHARVICERGTSADHQLRIYNQALEDGASKDEALKAIVDALMRDTIAV